MISESQSTLKRSAESDSQHLQKRARLLDDDSASDEDNDVLKVNEAYAARFKHNKERAELHRLEEKYSNTGGVGSEEDSTDDGSEDDVGELVDVDVDEEIAATLKAIRTKDPRIYSKDARFYTEKQPVSSSVEASKSKALYLRDYHRQNLLQNGRDREKEQPETYVQEQDSLKRSIVRDINAAAADDTDDDSNGGEFLVQKAPKQGSKSDRLPLPDPRVAEKDPETFLSNFFAARAWVPDDKSQFQPLESDDEDEDAKAEELEHAWNLRFEDPEISNKSLTSHSRDIIAKYTVRRDELSGRRRLREQDKITKAQRKQDLDEEKKRYKNLKIRQMEDKLGKIQEAAGIKGKDVNIDDWTDLLEGDWDDDKWNEEMTQRFGAHYYAADDTTHDDNDPASSTKLRKPRWEDDIDVDDLESRSESEGKPSQDHWVMSVSPEVENASSAARKVGRKSSTRRDRRIIEALAEHDLAHSLAFSKSTSIQPFKYRETSPNTFGLTPLDILVADDAQLNQFAGLKKLATFRDPERKRMDKKKLSKKARLRAWRKETFGREEGPDSKAFEVSNSKEAAADVDSLAADKERTVGPTERKRRRTKKPKAATVA